MVQAELDARIGHGASDVGGVGFEGGAVADGGFAGEEACVEGEAFEEVVEGWAGQDVRGERFKSGTRRCGEGGYRLRGR